MAQGNSLPTPVVSRGLDAILLPINDAVRLAFDLAPGETGVVVLAVAPGGIADLNGLQPGDVLVEIEGEVIRRPADVDHYIYRRRAAGQAPFFVIFVFVHDGAPVSIDYGFTVVDFIDAFTIPDMLGWTVWPGIAPDVFVPLIEDNAPNLAADLAEDLAAEGPEEEGAAANPGDGIEDELAEPGDGNEGEMGEPGNEGELAAPGDGNEGEL